MLRDDIISRTFRAAATLAAFHGYAVAQDGASTIQVWDNKAQVPLGILRDTDPTDGTLCTVALPGSVMYGVAGTTLTPGTHFFLTTDSADVDGQLIPAAAGEYYVATLCDTVQRTAGQKVQIQVAIGQLSVEGA